MSLFKKKEIPQANARMSEMILAKATEELKEEKEKNKSLRKDLKILDTENINYRKNLEVLQITFENIKEICKNAKTSTVAKKVLKELGE